MTKTQFRSQNVIEDLFAKREEKFSFINETFLHFVTIEKKNNLCTQSKYF